MAVVLNTLNSISQSGNALAHAITRALEPYINRNPAPRDLPALRRQFQAFGSDAGAIFNSLLSKDDLEQLWSLAEAGAKKAGAISNAAQAASRNCAAVRDFAGKDEFKTLAGQALAISEIYAPFFTGIMRSLGTPA